MKRNTHTEADMDIFAQAEYDELFTDEAHILVFFHEYYEGEYSIWYVVGKYARSVMDEENCSMLMDYPDWYYYSDYEDERYKSKQQKNPEYEQTESILNIPLEKFGDKDLYDLTQKYKQRKNAKGVNVCYLGFLSQIMIIYTFL